MRWALGLVFLGCAPPSTAHDFARIDDRLAKIEKRVDDVDAHATAAVSSAASACKAATPPAPPPKPMPAWSCAASCLKSFSCSSQGDNNVKWKAVSATGATAAEAFKAMEDDCADEIYTDGRCVNGKWTRTTATILNACVRN